MFSELLTEYLELRDKEKDYDAWEPISDRRARRARMEELLEEMNRLVRR